jgi:osmotically-inducible protein OsmY
MMRKLATALFVTGLAIAPAASYANGTAKSDATNAQTGTSSMQSQSGMTTHTTKTGAAVSDAEITTKVKAKLAADSGVSATRIHVDTDNGVVKLSGTAKSQDEAMKAENIAKNTEGVTSVDNAIQVSSAGAPSGASSSSTSSSTKY